MNHFNKFKQRLAIQMFLAISLPGIVGIVSYALLREMAEFDVLLASLSAATIYLVAVCLAYFGLFKTSIQPLEMVWQAIWHVSPGKSDVPPPNLQAIRIGHDLVNAMVAQVYELASTTPSLVNSASPKSEQPLPDENQLLESIPLALFVLDKDWKIKHANTSACAYVELEREKVVGKGVYDVLHLAFDSEDTLDSWLKESSENRATDSHTWQHVKLNIGGKDSKLFDLAASYSKDSSNGNEVVLALFGRGDTYSVQEQATSYVAMAVHELRTPLTMLRGYIELFEDELGDQLSPEHQEFMRKMSVAAQNLAAFVSNILNVARIDEDQFVLTLHEDNWDKVLHEIIDSLNIRAQVKGKILHLDIAPDLPKVGIDKISMYEVVNNLVDNAIKYGGQNPDIVISAKVGKEGMVETTVEDHGAGMPDNVISGLFTKYYRSHRSKNAVSGSGLGLYLVKTIVTAHGGNVWVQSKEGQGTTFGFSIQPYDQINDEDKTGTQDGIERQASGWIKNHSLYRR